MPAEPAAVIFDCDGTLVDTEPLTRVAMEQALGRRGLVMTDEVFHAMVGRAWPESAAILQERVGVTDLDDYVEDFRLAYLARHDEVAPFADAVAVAGALQHEGVPTAVCTSSGRAHLDRVLAMPAMDGLAFDAEVTREDTDRHKPHPAPYLLAAARLDIEPTACVAIEDSPTGARSALAAGMHVVVVDHGQHPPGSFTDLVVNLTTELTRADLRG